MGLVALSIVLVVIVTKFRGSGIVTTFSILAICVINWALFTWPLWASIVVGASLVWGLIR